MYGIKINDHQLFFPQAYGTDINYWPFLDLSDDSLQTKDTFQEFGTKGIALGKWNEELPAAGRSYPKPEVRGGGLEEQPHVQGAVAARAQEHQEELLHVQGQEGWQ